MNRFLTAALLLTITSLALAEDTKTTQTTAQNNDMQNLWNNNNGQPVKQAQVYKLLFFYQSGEIGSENAKQWIEEIRKNFGDQLEVREYEKTQNADDLTKWDIKMPKAPYMIHTPFGNIQVDPNAKDQINPVNITQREANTDNSINYQYLPAFILLDPLGKELSRKSGNVSKDTILDDLEHAGLKYTQPDPFKNIKITKGPLTRGKDKLFIFGAPNGYIKITVVTKTTPVKDEEPKLKTIRNINTSLNALFWDLKDNNGTDVPAGDYVLVIEDGKGTTKEIQTTIY